MSIFMGGSSPAVSERLEIRVLHHEPLGALALEAHLHARARARAFDVEDDALAELAVPHARTEPYAPRLGLGGAEAPDRERPRHLYARAHLLDELVRDLAHEARHLSVAVDAVQPALLGVAEIRLPHGARHADVAQPPLLLQAVEVGE